MEVTLGESFSLIEAYPNPVRSGQPATLDLTVRETQDVTVTLYDVLGRQVRTVRDGALEAQRTVRLTVEPSDLFSGTYLLRAEGEHFSATRQLVLVR